MDNLARVRMDDGSLPAYAWPGGYPIVYVMDDGEVLCPDCANGKNGSDASVGADAGSGWRIKGYQIHWEGEPEHCAHCNAEIPSAYGIPESD